MRPIINSQISELKESATLSINQHAIKLINDGEDICHLGFGESPFPVPNSMQMALRENSHRKQYISGRGLPELRKAVADFFQTQFGYNYAAKNIFISPGSKEMIFQHEMVKHLIVDHDIEPVEAGKMTGMVMRKTWSEEE